MQALAEGLTEDLPPEIARARESFAVFCRAVRPDLEYQWFHDALADVLDRFARGEIPRLLLCMPPQHGKTEFASRLFPAYLLGRNPNLRILATSYADDLASRTNLDVQRYIDSPAFQEVFPAVRLAGTVSVRSSGDPRFGGARRTAKAFEVVGHRGSYRSAGVDAGITGHPADVGFVDDPIKNRKQAESPQYLDELWRWYTSSFLTRLRPPKRVLVVMTRWHERDLVGRLLEREDVGGDPYTVLRLPAIAEVADRHPLDRREVGESLWPGRYPLAELYALRADLGSYQFDGMFQQRPTAPGGTILKRSWFKVVDPTAAPNGNVAHRVRFWDCASSDGTGDYTAGVRMARTHDGRFWVEHVVRERWGDADVDRAIRYTAQADGFDCRVREEREPGASGKAVVGARARDLAGFDYAGIPSDENKLLRWRRLAAQAEAGNVFLVAGPWVQDFLDELERLPGGAHDDQADAAAGALLQLAQLPLYEGGEVKLAGF